MRKNSDWKRRWQDFFDSGRGLGLCQHVSITMVTGGNHAEVSAGLQTAAATLDRLVRLTDWPVETEDQQAELAELRPLTSPPFHTITLRSGALVGCLKGPFPHRTINLQGGSDWDNPTYARTHPERSAVTVG